MDQVTAHSPLMSSTPVKVSFAPSFGISLAHDASEDKETVTVTVTTAPESCAAASGKPAATPAAPQSASQPVVIVPGTQSETATYNVPSAGGMIQT